VDYESSITPVFNQNPYITKQAIAIIESTNNGVWDCPEIISQGISYGTTQQQTNLVVQEFQRLENKWVASVKRDSNSRGGKNSGGYMKGQWVSVKFRKQSASTLVTLNLATMKWVESNLNTR
jgi:hypothetical protein